MLSIMGSHEEVERSGKWLFDFSKLIKVGEKIDPKNPVIPVVVQDANTKEVLICAYANEAALRYSLLHKIATFWSTSRNELWIKGQSSGDILRLIEIRVNCDQNSLLYLVDPVQKGACHVKDAHGQTFSSCYYRKIVYDSDKNHFSLEPILDVEL
jgi:phosphoribosyl-AMP cyclohydrolase